MTQARTRWSNGGPAETLRHASQVVVEAIARHREVQGMSALLERMPKNITAQELPAWRGRVDAFAFRTLYCDEAINARMRPAGASARRLHELLEQARVEALGVRRYPGAAGNLTAFHASQGVPAGAGITMADARLMAIVLNAVRQRIAAPSLGLSEFTLAAEEHESTLLNVRPLLDALAANIESQQAFAEKAVQLIAQVITSSPLEPVERKPLTMLTDPREDKRGSVRLMQTSARRSAEQTSVADAEPFANSGQRATRQDAATKDTARYKVFTRAHDWVGHARELCTASELQEFRRLLDQKLAGHAGDAQRWAHRLQRLLLAQRLSSWLFDLEEGVLDTARLTRVVTSPSDPLSFMQEAEAPFVDTAVTILVDNSGSMRGQSIESAAVCADLLGAVLERGGVKCEILGFTTRSWRGGQSRSEWMHAGQPPQPGRIAELCHVIYKSMDEPWRRARQSLGVMFKPNLLKDNIDGEALLWAYERLLARAEPRRILLVVSDGAPLDEATLEANEPAYLDRHLREVIARIVRGGAVELHAIGIGHDVTDYYPSAMMIRGPEELGRALFMRLAELLERHDIRPPRARRAS